MAIANQTVQDLHIMARFAALAIIAQPTSYLRKYCKPTLHTRVEAVPAKPKLSTKNMMADDI